jgi:CheY-like chemotaxis protein
VSHFFGALCVPNPFNSSDSSQTILLLDDDPHFRQMLARLFSLAGYKIVEAQSAMVASALLVERRPALCIVDYRLPGMNGLSWIKHMRQSGIDTPMVISTATSLDGEDPSELRDKLNIQLIIQKPINPATFLQQVEKYLAGQSISVLEPANGASSGHTNDFNGNSGYGSTPALLDSGKTSPDSFLVELEKELDVARVIYLRDTTRELRQFFSRVISVDTADVTIVKEVRHISHRIRGTSGSYRLPEVSKLAGMIEDLLLPGSNELADENEYLSCAISALMYELRQAVESELGTRDPDALKALQAGG